MDLRPCLPQSAIDVATSRNAPVQGRYPLPTHTDLHGRRTFEAAASDLGRIRVSRQPLVGSPAPAASDPAPAAFVPAAQPLQGQVGMLASPEAVDAWVSRVVRPGEAWVVSRGEKVGAVLPGGEGAVDGWSVCRIIGLPVDVAEVGP